MWLFIAPGLYQHERRFVYFLLPGSAILTVSGIILLYYVMLPLMLHVLVMVAADVQFLDPETAALQRRINPYLERVEEIPVRLTHPDELEEGSFYVLAQPTRPLSVFVVLPEQDGTLVPQPVPMTVGRVAQAFRVSFVINFTLLLMVGVVIAFQMPLVILLLGWLGMISEKDLRKNRKWALMICAVVAAMITPADAVSMLVMLVPLYALYELGIVLLRVAPAGRIARGGFRDRAARASAGRHGAADNADPDKQRAKAGQSREAIQSTPTVPRSPREDDDH
jgi:sec-independent protein translocase protein TatC